MLRLARSSAYDVERFLAQRRRLLEQLAERPMMRALDPARCDPSLADFAKIYPQTANLLTVDADGRLVCSAVAPAPGGPRAVDPDLYLNEIRRTRQFLIGKPNQGFITGRWVVSLALPILGAGGELRGVALHAIDLVKLSETRNDRGLPRSAISAIVDSGGRFISRSVDGGAWVGRHAGPLEAALRANPGESGTGQAVGVDGVERYFGYHRIPGTGWTAAVGMPTAELYAATGRNAIVSSAIALCAIALAAGLCVLVARRIATPIAEIAEVARRAGAGDSGARAASAGPDEVRRVATELNAMLERRAAAEAELRQMNRTLTVLSHCNQVVVRSTSEQQLLEEMCRLLVDQGGYALAWIGLVEHDAAKRVRPVASAGAVGYLDDLAVSWGDTPLGRGPAGTAIRTGQPVFSRDIRTDSRYEPWRDRIERFGFRSSIGLPVADDGAVFALLNLYSTTPNRFSEDEVRLLVELAGDLGFGLRSLRAQAQRRASEQALRASEERLAATLETITDGFFTLDREWRFTYLNAEAEHQMQRKRGELLGQVIWEEFKEAVGTLSDRQYREAMRSMRTVEFEQYYAPLGKWFEARAYPSDDGLAVYFRDVTARKEAERRLDESMARTRELSARLIEAEERERGRIARDLHDQVGQELTALKIRLDMLARATADPVQRARMLEIANASGEALQHVRQISVDLRPPQLDALGLAVALRTHVERQSGLGGTSIRFEGAELGRLPAELELTCFRVAQEALTNIVRHAKAAHAWVRLAIEENELRLTVGDDGVGFDPAASRPGKGGGIGLAGIAERVAFVGGRLDIRSQPGQGCTVSAAFPLRDAGAPAGGAGP